MRFFKQFVARLSVGRLLKLERHYLRETGWTKSHSAPVDSSGAPIPWMTYAAISFLDEKTPAAASVFEYGSGSSTQWWAARVASVRSCEHDSAWYAKVSAHLPENARLDLVPLIPDGDYCRQAARTGGCYDVIVIDGRDRVNCALNSVLALAPNGVVIWDDTERERYAPGRQFLQDSGFREIGFVGHGPMSYHVSRTSIFYREANCLGI